MYTNKKLLILFIAFILGSSGCSKNDVTCFYCESPTIRMTGVKNGKKNIVDYSLKQNLVSCSIDSSNYRCYYYDTVYNDTLHFLIFKETECFFTENIPATGKNLESFYYSSYCKKK